MQEAMEMSNADGDFGPATKKMVIAYQKANPGLEANGIVGPKTWEAIHTD
jgi:peptidoglycan hydrolase-like protein with peptidoglycan-binding domain